jgi:protease IV
MRSFFKMFFASFLALVIFCVIAFFLFIAVIAALASKQKETIASKSVLTIDLGRHFSERENKNPLGVVTGEGNVPGLYDLVRMIHHAKTDSKISGIFLLANENDNGFASSEEIRRALADFKTGGKFILAHGDMMTQKAYYIASVADKIYLNPSGALDWKGFSVELLFFKNTLDRLKIQPQIFYAGKFKSATEPFRVEKMTDANRLQTSEWLGSLYNQFLLTAASARNIDTASLHAMANNGSIQNADDALRFKLVDGLKYDDEVKDEIKQRLKLGKYDKMNFASVDKYADAASFRESGSGRIGLIYAEGNIVDGTGSKNEIGGDTYISLIRRMRLDKSIKAIVFRINSGGGSALASEKIWRELSLARKEKPLVVSFGDVAASGGYYIATAGDSIFSAPNTITGSIGVFGMIPNLQGFFNDKLGVTFDGVKTSPFADNPNAFRAMTEAEKNFAQKGIERTYLQFKQRVAQGRKKDINYIDSIAQGRVWSGEAALRLGLVDKMGDLSDAVACAARMAKLSSYRLREYPESGSWLNELLDRKSKDDPETMIKEKMGDRNYEVFQQLVELNQLCGQPQARLPFQFLIH